MYSQVLKRDTTDIVRQIVRAYEKDCGVFTKKVNAEDMIPKTTKNNQVQFLFWVIQMDYATRSSNLYDNSLRLWKENKSWIDTKFLLSLDKSELTSLISTKLKPRYKNEIVKRFRTNARKLRDDYSNQAINIVKRSKSARELLSNIKQFRGFGPKLGNFLTRTYIDLLKPDYPDINEILQPVDIHDIRLTYEWGLIKSKKMTKRNIDKVKSLWNKACKKAGISWITFDKALWLIGSVGQRSKNPQKDYIINLGI